MVKGSHSNNIRTKSDHEIARICVVGSVYLQNKTKVRVNHCVQPLMSIGKGKLQNRSKLRFNDEVTTVTIV